MNNRWLCGCLSSFDNRSLWLSGEELVFLPISMVGISNGWNRISIDWIFLPIFAKPNGWKNPMVEPISNGWIRLLKCILSNGCGMVLIGWKSFLDVSALAKFEHSWKSMKKGGQTILNFFYQIVNS